MRELRRELHTPGSLLIKLKNERMPWFQPEAAEHRHKPNRSIEIQINMKINEM